MTLQHIPGLAVLLADKIYMTFAHSADNLSGIKTLQEAFTEKAQLHGFQTAIEITTGRKFDDIRGTIVVRGNVPVSAAIAQFSTCAFRLEAAGPVFVARFLKPCGDAFGQELSILAITDENDPLIARHRQWIDDGEPDDFKVSYDELRDASLQPAFAAVAITESEIGGNQGDGSEDYGNGKS